MTSESTETTLGVKVDFGCEKTTASIERVAASRSQKMRGARVDIIAALHGGR